MTVCAPLFTPRLSPLLYEPLVRRALEEDLGTAGDLTTDAIVSPDASATAVLVARQAGRVAGLEAALSAFTMLDPGMRTDVIAGDGTDAAAGRALARLTGSARALLTAERTALNLLGRLCGIATATRDLVALVSPYGTRVLCTRKTTPGLRALEKYAVRTGGGVNHRFGLSDAVLVKDNHVAVAGGIGPAVDRVRRSVGPMVKIEVEVDTLDQLREALDLGIDAVLLDNMPPAVLAEAVALARGRATTEASGGITPDTARAIAATGVDYMSVGWLTHGARSLDVALDVEVG
jgi:nicotinate-nucleotide pyrophosphorylase (carboxylating)